MEISATVGEEVEQHGTGGPVDEIALSQTGHWVEADSSMVVRGWPSTWDVKCSRD